MEISVQKEKTYTRTVQIRFDQADPAGIMYFANIFNLAHRTFEDFIVEAGIPWAEWFRKSEYAVPIRHTECNYLAPFLPGKQYDVRAQVARLGETSFQMMYTFSSKSGIHAVVTMVHAFIDTDTKDKFPMPAKIREILKPYLKA
jgi:acyl-CoA thioesterase FadM